MYALCLSFSGIAIISGRKSPAEKVTEWQIRLFKIEHAQTNVGIQRSAEAGKTWIPVNGADDGCLFHPRNAAFRSGRRSSHAQWFTNQPYPAAEISRPSKRSNRLFSHHLADEIIYLLEAS